MQVIYYSLDLVCGDLTLKNLAVCFVWSSVVLWCFDAYQTISFNCEVVINDVSWTLFWHLEQMRFKIKTIVIGSNIMHRFVIHLLYVYFVTVHETLWFTKKLKSISNYWEVNYLIGYILCQNWFMFSFLWILEKKILVIHIIHKRRLMHTIPVLQ